jgi:transaldolase
VPTDPLRSLARLGQSPWLDYISRPFIADGELAHLVDMGVLGLTSNPTIFQEAIAAGDAYDEQIRTLAGGDAEEIFLALAAQDIRNACDALRGAFDRGDSTRDGWVSLEVDPTLANDAAATATQAQRLHELVGRPNLFVKIPGTENGLEAIEETIARGIPVNVTLLFSLERHRAAAQAYLRGLRRLRDAGGDLRSVASVASFFVSRVDTEADRRLDELGGHEQLKGKLGIANAKLAYQDNRRLFSGPDWAELEAEGASPQRCLWASPSTKNPAYRDVMYIEELIGPQTVNTMPRETLEAFQDHGRAELTLERGLDDAQRTFDALAQAGVDYDDVVDVLEDEGVEKFAASFRELLDGVAAKREQLVSA